jgi:hypothetical protein
MIAILILLAQLILGPEELKADPKFQAWFDTAKIGDRYDYIMKAGDGCNTCIGAVRKVSDDSVADTDVHACTSLGCITVKPEIKVR